MKQNEGNGRARRFWGDTIDICTDTCPTELTACGDACIDLQTSKQNCGACGARCEGPQRCVAGACQAP